MRLRICRRRIPTFEISVFGRSDKQNIIEQRKNNSSQDRVFKPSQIYSTVMIQKIELCFEARVAAAFARGKDISTRLDNQLGGKH